jgi:hypothetical protein
MASVFSASWSVSAARPLGASLMVKPIGGVVIIDQDPPYLSASKH